MNESGTITARSQNVRLQVQGVGDEEEEHHHRRLDEDGAAEAAGQRDRPIAKPRQHGGQRVDALADPLGMKHRQRLQQPAESGRRQQRRRRRGGAGQEPGPQPQRPDLHAGAVAGAGDRGGERRDQDQTHQAEHPIHQHDRGGQRLGPAGRAVSRMRITSPPMLLGRKLLKNSATSSDPSSERLRTWTPCASSSSCQRQVLASTLIDVDAQRHEQPRQRRLACARPQRADVDARKQQP